MLLPLPLLVVRAPADAIQPAEARRPGADIRPSILDHEQSPLPEGAAEPQVAR